MTQFKRVLPKLGKSYNNFMAEIHPSRADQAGIRRIYDWIGARYDWFSFYEARAKAAALDLLEASSGQRILNVGCGTGKEHARLQRDVQPSGQAHGLDASYVMASLAQRRSGAPLLQADAARLPYAGESFERVFCTYVLDLMPFADLPAILDEFRRVLKPHGRLVLLSLTEGCTAPSRAFVGLWKLVYRISPLACAGCRPLQLSTLAASAGFRLLQRQVIIQFGVPSELILAEKEHLPVSV